MAGLVGVSSANAAMLVDRGLPTANLDNSAGVNRSAVAWVDGGYGPTDYWMVGDTFTNTSSQTWSIDTIRLWTVNSTATAALWGGIAGSTIGLASSSGTISTATYSDLTTYQGYSGAYRDMFQVDFGVNITLAAGQSYDFFLDGTGGSYTIPFVHASNAALSGSPQDGADNSMLWGEVVSGNFNQTSVQPWTSLNNGWDKASDVNVQAFGSIGAVPEPETYAMLLAGLGLVGVVARRRKQAQV